jgi:hypothetical protein
MTELNTVALPAAAPASREAAGQEAIRPSIGARRAG